MTLLEYLMQYKNKKTLPMHMPGHKRNVHLAPYLQKLGADCDVTEIDNMDDLHDPTGILKECQSRAAKLWHSRHSFFLVNGSTCGILAGIRACTKYGDSVLVARNCHKSVYNAIELCGLNPVYILPKMLDGSAIYEDIKPAIVEQALNENNGIALIIITSPTYEGVISNVRAIARITHSHGIPLLVDEAHGAHLELSPYFTGGAVASGADVAVQSLHKTLPSLTQTAILHLNSNLIEPHNIQRQLAVFQTSSPSYLLMSSIDSCVSMLSNTPKLFESWHNNLEYFKKLVKPLKNLSILNYTFTCENLYGFDSSKLVIITSGTNITGKQLMDILRQNYNIELEMCGGDYALAMTSLADSRESLHQLANALLSIDSTVAKSEKPSPRTAIIALPARRLSTADAIGANYENVALCDSIGRTCCEYVWLYPPGIPIITPGEIINDETVSIINTAVENKINLQKTLSESAELIAVTK